MSDVNREKFVRAMAEVDELEERVERLEEATGGDQQARRLELAQARKELADKMWELARITDACRKIHVRK